jgi:predicted metal-binding membrane protein
MSAMTRPADGNGMSMAMRAMPSSRAMAMSAFASARALTSFTAMWALMVAAMMTPLLIGPLRYLYARSLPRRRGREMVLFLVAYSAVWVVLAPAFAGVAEVIDWTSLAAAVAIAIALLWQASPPKQVCSNHHHVGPALVTFGWPADFQALRFGASQACWCVGSCWALMLLPVVITAHAVLVMILVSVWVWGEQFDLPKPAAWRVRAPLRALRIVRWRIAYFVVPTPRVAAPGTLAS